MNTRNDGKINQRSSARAHTQQQHESTAKLTHGWLTVTLTNLLLCSMAGLKKQDCWTAERQQ